MSNSQNLELSADFDVIEILEDDGDNNQMGMDFSKSMTNTNSPQSRKIVNGVGEIINAVDNIMGNDQKSLNSSLQESSDQTKSDGSRSRKVKAGSRNSEDQLKNQLEIDMVDQPKTRGVIRSAEEQKNSCAGRSASADQVRRSLTPLDRLKNMLAIDMMGKIRPSKVSGVGKRRVASQPKISGAKRNVSAGQTKQHTSVSAKTGRKPPRGTSHGNLRGTTTSKIIISQRKGASADISRDRLRSMLAIDMVDQPKSVKRGRKVARIRSVSPKALHGAAAEAARSNLIKVAAEAKTGNLMSLTSQRVKYQGSRSNVQKLAKRSRPNPAHRRYPKKRRLTGAAAQKH